MDSFDSTANSTGPLLTLDMRPADALATAGGFGSTSAHRATGCGSKSFGSEATGSGRIFLVQVAEMRELREKRQLHPVAEARLKELLGKIPLQNYGLSEAWGVTGGRTDLCVFLRHRNVIHFEIFGHPNTVHRDANNLHMSRADVKVAVLIDEEADPAVAESYFRTVSDNRFPWCRLSLLLDPEKEAEAIRTLTEYITQAIKSEGALTGPTASIAPASGTPFVRARLQVSGFHPFTTFSAFWDPEGQTCVIAGGIEMDENGSGKCDVFIPDGRLATVGPHTIKVVDSVGNVATARFEVTEAWPAPYIRAVPSSISPGEQLTVIGGGAPRDGKIMVHFWNGNHGDGRPETADQAGNFQCVLEVPWLVGMDLVKPGRHRVSAGPAPVAGGSPPYHINTFVEVPGYSAPETLQWKSGHTQSRDDICILRPEFIIQGDLITIRLPIRNDRKSAVQLLPDGGPIVLDLNMDLRSTEYRFQCVAIEHKPIFPGQVSDVTVRFRRLFAFIPRTLLPTARSLTIVLLFATAEGQTIRFVFVDTWPAEAYAEPSAALPSNAGP
jgi:hypothetical protein